MSNIFISLRQLIATRNTEPPSHHAFQLEELDEYFAKHQYSWKREGGKIIGTLERGFGRTFRVEWDPSDKSVTMFNISKTFFNVSTSRTKMGILTDERASKINAIFEKQIPVA